MKSILTVFILIQFTLAAYSQDCYHIFVDKGNALYKSGKYAEAKKKFEAAKNCSTLPANNNLDALIANCNQKLKTSSKVKVVKHESTGNENSKTRYFIDSRDGHRYETVKIGKQVWMAENLAYKSSKGCWVYDNDQSYVAKYCYLYNWETANKVCPSGWHLPSDEEWKQLEMALGMTNEDANKEGWRGTVGNALKSRSGWSKNENTTNSSGFTAVLSGYRDTNGSFNNAGHLDYYWTSTPSGSEQAWGRGLYCDYSEAYRSQYDGASGFSVRCTKD